MEDLTKYPLLQKINSPADLRKLPEKDLPQVCSELRGFIIDSLANNPGHFASSLGSVELTVALHYVFSTPDDKLVWDVGHQAYGHKILTGRRDRFHTNRKFGGVKPFPSPDESEYDSFVAGHASTSISAALGLSVSAQLQGRDEHVVAIIGDGSMSGGLAYEGLNNLSNTPNNLLVVLNDNNMSIDKSVGGMSQLLISMHSSRIYNKIRYKIAQGLRKIGLLNEERANALIRFNNGLKAMLFRQRNIFEGMSARYFGPINGHDVHELVRMLRSIKDMTGPRMLHIHTVKGKGWEPAEKNATVWHQPGIFDIETGERLVTQGGSPRFQDVFGETLVELAKADERIIGITPAMPTGCSMNKLMEELREIQMAYGIPVQSHLSESKGEIEFVKLLRPDALFYGDSYDRYDLFGKNDDINTDVKTVMAHCVWSTDEEVELMRKNGVFVAHCPASNLNLTSGIAPIRKYLELGLNIGLGSDVAGGHSESIFRAITDAIQSSKIYYRTVDEGYKPLIFPEAFYLATKGGGAFFGKVGSFENGYEFDAVIMDDGVLPHPQELTLAERMERAVYLGLDEKNITAKFVAGRKII